MQAAVTIRALWRHDHERLISIVNASLMVQDGSAPIAPPAKKDQ